MVINSDCRDSVKSCRVNLIKFFYCFLNSGNIVNISAHAVELAAFSNSKCNNRIDSLFFILFVFLLFFLNSLRIPGCLLFPWNFCITGGNGGFTYRHSAGVIFFIPGFCNSCIHFIIPFCHTVIFGNIVCNLIIMDCIYLLPVFICQLYLLINLSLLHFLHIHLFLCPNDFIIFQ